MNRPRLRPVAPQPQHQDQPPRLYQRVQDPVPGVWADAFLAANFTDAAGGGKMHFDTIESVSKPTLFDPVNFWFVCPRAGRYDLKVGIGISAAPIALYTIDAVDNVSGTLLRRMLTDNNVSANNINLSASTILRLKGGEHVYINFTGTWGVGITVLGGSLNSWYQITRVSDL